jgi:mono/diheme cytochrome c family protein
MSQPTKARIAGILLLLLLPGGMACSRRHPPSRTAPPPSRAEVALAYDARMGQVTYRHYCQTCHGETGAGDGFNAFNLDPHPRDLSDPAFQRAKKDADLADAIRRGGAGVGLSALMPPWGHTLSDRQIDDVVAYLRTFKR